MGIVQRVNIWRNVLNDYITIRSKGSYIYLLQKNLDKIDATGSSLVILKYTANLRWLCCRYM